MSLINRDRKIDPELQAALELMYDHDAADRATPEDARQRLRVIKHYVRAAFGDEDINLNVKNFIQMFGLSCELPWSVVGGYDFLLLILKTLHKCGGRPCVLRLKKKELPASLKIALKKEVSTRRAKARAKIKKPSSKSKGKKDGTRLRQELKKLEMPKQRDIQKGKERKLKSILVTTDEKSLPLTRGSPIKEDSKQCIKSKTAEKSLSTESNSPVKLIDKDYLLHYV